MADALKLQQLSGMFAGMGQANATYNPAQRSMLNYLQGSAQSSIQAEAQKKAEKKAKKKSGIGGLLGGAAAIAAAPFTGGASLAYAPAAMSAGNAIEGAASGDTTSALSNAMSAGMGAYGAYKSDREPIIKKQNVASSPTNAYLNTPIAKSADSPGMFGPNTAGQEKSFGPPDKRPDMSGFMGGPHQMMQHATFSSMSPRELGKMSRTDPTFTDQLQSYLMSGGQITPQMARYFSPATKYEMRQAGYQMPGPFGVMYK